MATDIPVKVKVTADGSELEQMISRVSKSTADIAGSLKSTFTAIQQSSKQAAQGISNTFITEQGKVLSTDEKVKQAMAAAHERYAKIEAQLEGKKTKEIYEFERTLKKEKEELQNALTATTDKEAKKQIQIQKAALDAQLRDVKEFAEKREHDMSLPKKVLSAGKNFLLGEGGTGEAGGGLNGGGGGMLGGALGNTIALGGMATGVAGATMALEKLFDAGKEAKEREEEISIGFRSVGMSAQQAAERTEEVVKTSRETGQAMGYSHVEVEKATAAYLKLGGTSDNLKQHQEEILALAKKTGSDVESSAQLYAKAMNGNIAMLGRYLPALKGVTDKGEAMKILHEQLAGTMEGMKEAANGPIGQFNRFKDSMSSLAENIGGIIFSALNPLFSILGSIGNIIGEFVVPAISVLGSILTAPLKLFGLLGDLIKEYSPYFITFASIIGAITIAMNLSTIATYAKMAAEYAAAAATGAMTIATNLLNASFIASPIGWIVLGIAALAVALVQAYKHWEGFRKAVDAAWKAIKDAAEWVKNIGTSILSMLGLVKEETEAEKKSREEMEKKTQALKDAKDAYDEYAKGIHDKMDEEDKDSRQEFDNAKDIIKKNLLELGTDAKGFLKLNRDTLNEHQKQLYDEIQKNIAYGKSKLADVHKGENAEASSNNLLGAGDDSAKEKKAAVVKEKQKKTYAQEVSDFISHQKDMEAVNLQSQSDTLVKLQEFLKANDSVAAANLDERLRIENENYEKLRVAAGDDANKQKVLLEKHQAALKEIQGKASYDAIKGQAELSKAINEIIKKQTDEEKKIKLTAFKEQQAQAKIARENAFAELQDEATNHQITERQLRRKEAELRIADMQAEADAALEEFDKDSKQYLDAVRKVEVEKRNIARENTKDANEDRKELSKMSIEAMKPGMAKELAQLDDQISEQSLKYEKGSDLYNAIQEDGEKKRQVIIKKYQDQEAEQLNQHLDDLLDITSANDAVAESKEDAAYKRKLANFHGDQSKRQEMEKEHQEKLQQIRDAAEQKKMAALDKWGEKALHVQSLSQLKQRGGFLKFLADNLRHLIVSKTAEVLVTSQAEAAKTGATQAGILARIPMAAVEVGKNLWTAASDMFKAVASGVRWVFSTFPFPFSLGIAAAVPAAVFGLYKGAKALFKFAEGGIADSPIFGRPVNGHPTQAGEAGPELIMPLKKLPDLLPRVFPSLHSSYAVNPNGQLIQEFRNMHTEMKAMHQTLVKKDLSPVILDAQKEQLSLNRGQLLVQQRKL